MVGGKTSNLIRRLLILGIMVFSLMALSMPPAGRNARADAACCEACLLPWTFDCQQNCLDTWCPGPSCNQPMFARCREQCEQMYHTCLNQCGDCE